MTILFPLAQSDRNHAEAQLRLLQAFGPYLEDRAILLPTPSAYHDPMLRKVVDGVAALFSPENVKIEVCPNDFDGGWPFNPNCHFKFAMEVANITGWDNTPMIWMEPDLMPCTSNWLKLVKDDYKIGSTPFRGMLNQTRYEDTDPRTKVVTPRYDAPEDMHFVGAGIYPMGYVRYSCPNPNGGQGSPMASYRNPSYTIPFDVRCKHQHKPATQSPLWLHRPRTINWRRVSVSKFSCEDQTKDRFGLTYAGECDLSGVALVHGPKDHSFAEAILGAGVKEPFVLAQPELQPQPITTGPGITITPTVTPQLTEGEKAMEAQFVRPPDAPSAGESALRLQVEVLEERIQELVEQGAVILQENTKLKAEIEELKNPKDTPKTEAKAEPKKAVPAKKVPLKKTALRKTPVAV